MTVIIPSSSEIDAEVAPLCHDLARVALEGRLDELFPTTFGPAVAQWARNDIPLPVLHKHLLHGVRFAACQNAVAESTEPRPRLVAEALASALSSVSQTYLGEVRAQQTPQQRLLSALINGRDTAEVERGCGLEIAASYLVVAVDFPASASSPAMSGYHCLRLGTQLTRECGSAALAELSERGGTVLLPVASTDQLPRCLTPHNRSPFTVTVTRAGRTEIPEAVRLAHELLDLALLLGRVGTLHRFEDLAAEYQITRPGPARDHLASALVPLADTPHLLTTLSLYLRRNSSRRKVARGLTLHPNTVDYRLKRIATLTGHDPTQPHGLWYLHCAWVAWASSNALGYELFSDNPAGAGQLEEMTGARPGNRDRRPMAGR